MHPDRRHTEGGPIGESTQADEPVDSTDWVSRAKYEDLEDRIESVLWESSTSVNSLKQASVKLQRESDERVRLQDELAVAQKLESVGQLAAGIAHEINTPLQYVGDNTHFLETALKNILEMLDYYDGLLEAAYGDDEDSAKAKAKATAKAKALKLDFLKRKIPRSIASTIEGVESVSSLVRAMKEFSHPGDGDKTLTDINRAIATTITVSRNEWKYLAEVDTNFDDSMPLVPCLPGELNQVVLNMIVNSAHAIGDVVREGGDRGRIEVRTRCDEGWAEINISDTGGGISDDLKKKIFDPFFTTKEVGKGTGQGLSIAHSIVVDKHQGTIDVQSEVGCGTTFTIRLPLEASESEKSVPGTA